MAQPEPGTIILCFSARDPNCFGRGCHGSSCQRSFLLSSGSWKRSHTATLHHSQAPRCCLPLSQLSAIRCQTIKLLWNVSEDDGGHSRVTPFRQICRRKRRARRNRSTKVKTFISFYFRSFWIWILTTPVCCRCYILSCHWRVKVQKKKENLKQRRRYEYPVKLLLWR